MKELILALQFLTRFPIPIAVPFNNQTLAKSLFFFPIVSGMIGFIVGIVYQILFPYNPMVSSAISLLVWYLLNGGLHLDGLADMFDGFLSNRDKERTLEIMKDSRVGTFGVMSLIFIFLIKYTFLSATSIGCIEMALTLIYARIGVLFLIGFFSPAKKDGLGIMFQENGKPPFLFSIFLWGILGVFYEPKMLFLLILSLACSFLLGVWSNKKIGGVTGDIFGAVMEINEAVVLFAFWGIQLWI
ncbi:adenosylcobinamide-GDP ribazoletransferase [Peptoniphilus sp. KCTC 25270]|uniref:adenosylcobinamide-GDP ribazoletransferase n=1 Tax=Peptoniphilus sp. KCTC 25270 TaxID=2897414 RepID=UPI001E2DE552|nr:adenosylcobinamide-GDP ribazoletransferase [Peptoniphilus sp. KCTC 25270]MCD1146945.1 adenosylcobinamide-GDP ribazoletransferase [Peptoniphilus sp. KCTC 25270]